MSALIAIVGRPNVGKSALFNRLAGRRIAIVHDEPGVTRDRVMVETEWLNRRYTLVDTGGIGLVKGQKGTDAMLEATVEQVQLAIEAAQVILFVVDGQSGIAPLDREVAIRLRETAKPVLVVVNKLDNATLEEQALEFTELGFGVILPVSAIHGRGVDEVMKEAFKHLPEEPPAENPESVPDEEILKLAIVGRPNVGKSSLINSLARSDRVIVTPVPGTTRDAIDVPIEVDTDGRREHFILIDTAGVRKERRIDNSIEFYSVKRTDQSIERCDLAILVLDAEVGITEQDKKIAGKIVEARKACVVLVNKWDLVKEAVVEARKEEIQRRRRKERRPDSPQTTLGEFAEWVQEQLFFLDYAPVIFTSAKSGFHLDRFLEAVRIVAAQLKQKIPTALLNRTLHHAIEQRQPISATGQRLKFFYATQTHQTPPTFLLFVNKDELFSTPYTKYLVGELRKSFGFEGCPLILVPKPRPKTIDPIRKHSK